MHYLMYQYNLTHNLLYQVICMHNYVSIKSDTLFTVSHDSDALSIVPIKSDTLFTVSHDSDA